MDNVLFVDSIPLTVMAMVTATHIPDDSSPVHRHGSHLDKVYVTKSSSVLCNPPLDSNVHDDGLLVGASLKKPKLKENFNPQRSK